MSSPVSSAYNLAMQELCEMRYTTNEQHKETTGARIAMDKEDLTIKLSTMMGCYTPFSDGNSLRNIITGINVDDNVYVHDLFKVGNDTVTKMEGQYIFSYSYKRNTKVNLMIMIHARLVY